MIECETLKVVPIGYQRLVLAAAYNEAMSHCKRRHVGCVVGNVFGDVLGAGLNSDHRRNAHIIRGTCAADAVGKCGCMHAEVRAILSISNRGAVPQFPSTSPTIVAVTAAPCLGCAQTILDFVTMTRNGPTDIDTVLFWEESLPGEEGVAELLNYGVKVYRVPSPVKA